MISLNGHKIEPTIFPDQTSQIWKLKPLHLKYKENIINWKFESESELIQVFQLVMLVRQLEVNSDIILMIPYFPYARQDKSIANDSTFALNTFCKLLKPIEEYVNEIITVDLHSSVAHSYFKKLTDKFPANAIDIAVEATKPDFIIFPDMGAQTRYKTYLPVFEGRIETATIIKSRDQLTGDLKITGINISSPRTLEGASCLMIDDICDGGRTFIAGKEFLDKFGIKDLSLYTTHGIYSKGTQVLKDSGIKRLFNLYGEVL